MTTTHPDPHTCPARGVELRTADEIEAERQHYRMRCEALGWVVLPGWQPIETAPHGVDLVLCWYSDWSKQWLTEINVAVTPNTCHPRSGASNGSAHGQATHWIPIPAAPASPA